MSKRNKYISHTIIFIILFVIAVLFLIPFIWTFLTSIKTDKDIYVANLKLLPSTVTLLQYERVYTQMGSFVKFFMNSVIVSFWSVLLIIIFSTTMGYSFSKIEYRGKNIFFAFILLVLTIPYVIYLVPLYIMEMKLSLIDTLTGLVLPYVALNLPLSVFIMRSQFNSVPNALGEAARIDGCTQWQVFMKIMLPVVKPGIATVIIYAFINVWGEFTFSRTLTVTPKAQTLPVGITFLRDQAASFQYGPLCATIVLSLIPVLIVFMFMQRYLIKGIMAGAIKG